MNHDPLERLNGLTGLRPLPKILFETKETTVCHRQKAIRKGSRNIDDREFGEARRSNVYVSENWHLGQGGAGVWRGIFRGSCPVTAWWPVFVQTPWLRNETSRPPTAR